MYTAPCAVYYKDKAMQSSLLQKRKAFLAAGVVFVALLLVPGAIGVIWYRTDQSITARTYLQQQTLVNLAASAVKVKIDHLVGIAESIASLDQISKSVANARWNDAAQSASNLQNNVTYYDPFIDRIIFYDTDGIQQAAYPTLVGGIGSSATSSAWYQALDQGGANSYVSGVAKRLSMPQINVVSIAVPIKANGATKGFLILQIPTDNFLEFGTDLSIGTYGFTYIVDAKGNLVSHPQFSSQNGVVVSYSFMPAVKEILAGKTGGMVTNDPNGGGKSIVVYELLPQYQWGVVVQEPYAEVFAVRDDILFSYFIEIIIALVVDFMLSLLIYRLLVTRSEYKKS